MTAFDITAYPLLRINGQKQDQMPGFSARTAPPHCVRSRKNDRLFIYLAVRGNIDFPDDEIRALTAEASEIYFQTSGAVTSALRAAATLLNDALAQRNLASSGQGSHLVGRAVLAATRGDTLYLLISGPCEIISLAESKRRFLPADKRAGSGLGVSRNTTYFLTHLPLSVPQKIVFCADAPKQWQNFFVHEKADTPAQVLTETLWQLNAADFHALMLDVHAPDAKPAPEPVSTPPSAQEEKPSAAPPAQTPPVKKSAAKPSRRLPVMALPKTSPETRRQQAESLLGKIHAFRAKKQKVSQAVGKFLPRLLPTSSDSIRIAPWLLMLIAVIVPILVAATASIVYTRQGLRHEAKTYYLQALSVAEQARRESSPALQREEWLNVLNLLGQANQIYPLPESLTLEEEARTALDTLEHIIRLTYRHAEFTLPTGANIIQMAAARDTLFMLDAQTHGVLRAVRTPAGYNLDAKFACQPGTYANGAEPITVGALIDLVALPEQHPSGAEVLALDAQGNLLYCRNGQAPRASTLAKPELGLQSITAITLAGDYLYVLDPAGRAVWIYPADPSGFFSEAPLYFFDEQVPRVENALDLVIYDGDLFLLNRDSTLTVCRYGRMEGIPNRCEDPIILQDSRPGHGDTPAIPDTAFSQIVLSPQPNNAIFLLDGSHQSIYRISPSNRNVQGLFQPAPQNIPNEAVITSLAVDPQRILFISTGSDIYYATHIP